VGNTRIVILINCSWLGVDWQGNEDPLLAQAIPHLVLW
jgi:hypothetical protein